MNLMDSIIFLGVIVALFWFGYWVLAALIAFVGVIVALFWLHEKLFDVSKDKPVGTPEIEQINADSGQSDDENTLGW